ncbi:MAG TPA: copper amine oxidase N-terminal domain-containing protein [Symbiobacteriaceae bacterium]|nr:copper amine oxidase N-terminal domain-containing protein [Symbiobacteriaceae bacterium]
MLAAILLGSGAPLPGTGVAAAAENCLPAKRLPVTLLVRSGEAFVPLSTDGADPFIDGYTSRTVVPMRSLFEALSPGGEGVRWNEATRTSTFSYAGKSVSITFAPGTSRADFGTVNGKSTRIDAVLCGGRVWVQARRLMEAMGVDIQYFEGGIVVIDPLRQPGLPSTGRTVRDLPGYGTVSAQCSPFPESFLNFMAHPIDTTRQAGDAVACMLLQS